MRFSTKLTGMVVGLLVLCSGNICSSRRQPACRNVGESVPNDRGRRTESEPAAFLILSANGHFSQTAAPAGRPKVTKPLQDMTREELLARFQGVQARRGTVHGRRQQADPKGCHQCEPQSGRLRGCPGVRLEGDMLTLSSTDPKSKAQAKFRRVK